jgi:hypothetical protein
MFSPLVSMISYSLILLIYSLAERQGSAAAGSRPQQPIVSIFARSVPVRVDQFETVY